MRDDTYSNQPRCIIARSMHSPREVNQMEREMSNCLLSTTIFSLISSGRSKRMFGERGQPTIRTTLPHSSLSALLLLSPIPQHPSTRSRTAQVRFLPLAPPPPELIICNRLFKASWLEPNSRRPFLELFQPTARNESKGSGCRFITVFWSHRRPPRNTVHPLNPIIVFIFAAYSDW